MNLSNETLAVLYVRSAAVSQSGGDDNLRDQEERCRAYCAEQGWAVKAVFEDSCQSGNSLVRPGFQKLLSFCQSHQGEVRYVVVADFARLARDFRIASEAFRKLTSSGVRVRSTLDVETNASSPGKLAKDLIDAFSKYFDESTSEE